MNIYYYHPLVFHFYSTMTLQVVRDMKHLSKHGHNVFLYGTYLDAAAYAEVCEYIGDAPISLLVMRGDSKWRLWLRCRFLWWIYTDNMENKVAIARKHMSAETLLRFRRGLGDPLILLELHEKAFPHLLTSGRRSENIRRSYVHVFKHIDGLSLTNYSQEVILEREFENYPPYDVFPNGVEWDRFNEAKRDLICGNDRFVVTLVSQFREWKNTQLVFQALSLLDDRFSLRIAGGKNDAQSQAYIEEMAIACGVQGRVDYLGFVSPERVGTDVLDGSSALVLPLGDNLVAQYFTSPMKLFEYMATRIPVVAVDYPSVSLVTGQDTVFLSANDPESFAHAIRKAVASPDLEQRIQNMNARAKRFTYKERARRYDRWLAELAAQRTPATHRI